MYIHLAIDEYSGEYTTKMALKMLPYVFVRSFNIRHCEWSEIDFKNQQWIIPSHKMKTKIEFILPLSNQVIEILKEIQQFSGEVIEALLSHKESNKVKESYNRASYKDSMKNLINWYANYLKNIN